MAGSATLKIFNFEYPFEHNGSTYDKLEVRRPKVRDLKNFVKDAENTQIGSVGAIERQIASLSETPPAVIAEIDLEDFAPIKAWFTTFLKLISDASEIS